MHQNGGFEGKGGVDAKFWFLRPTKGTSLRRTASFDVLCVNVRGGVLAVDDSYRLFDVAVSGSHFALPHGLSSSS